MRVVWQQTNVRTALRFDVCNTSHICNVWMELRLERTERIIDYIYSVFVFIYRYDIRVIVFLYSNLIRFTFFPFFWTYIQTTLSHRGEGRMSGSGTKMCKPTNVTSTSNSGNVSFLLSFILVFLASSIWASLSLCVHI